MAPGLHAKGHCETTAALRVPALEDGQVDGVGRRVQGPAIRTSREAHPPPGSAVPAPRPSCGATLVSGHGDSATSSSAPPRCGLQHGGSIRLIGLIAAVSLRCSSPVFRSRRVAGPVSPSRSGNGQSRPVTEHRPPAWGQQVLQGDYWVQILGTVHRQPSIQIRCRWNYPVPVPQMNNVLLPRNRACNTVPPALNQRPWSTSRRFTPIRRWAGGLIRMFPAFGLQWTVVPEFPARPLRGQCAVPVPASRAGPATGER